MPTRDAFTTGAPPPGKGDLRRRFLDARSALGPSAEELGARAERRLIAHEVFRDADVILVYLPFRGEVSTKRVVEAALARGKVVAAPVTLKAERKLLPLRLTGHPEELRRGAYGILEPEPSRCEPVPAATLDLVVVPGVAFDLGGGRLGYGGGYYDRFLSTEATGATRAALAFEAQISEEPLPLDPFDVRVDFVFTERRILRRE